MGPHERLTLARRNKNYPTATDAARAFGWNEVTYRAHESGGRGIKKELNKYARAFNVSAAWLLTGEGKANSSMSITHAIGDDGKIIALANPKRVQEVPDGDIDTCIEIQTDQIFPNYRRGDVLYVSAERIPPDQAIGIEGIVEVKSGPGYMGMLTGSLESGQYTLIRLNRPPTHNLKVDSVRKITWLKRN